MNIVWFSWKDIEHPSAGGAEMLTDELLTRLVRDGHQVILLTGSFPTADPTVRRNGYQVIRLGGRFSVYWEALRYYRKRLTGWADIVVEEVNTAPFFTAFYTRVPHVLFFHQLTREVWFYQMPFPVSLVGYLVEPVYLFILSLWRGPVVTVSESSKQDLMRYGFKGENIHIISEGIHLEPVVNLMVIEKSVKPVMLSLGSIRPMKRTHHIVRAFEIAKESIPDLHLLVVGSAPGSYGSRVLRMIEKSKYKFAIEYLARVDDEIKADIMQKAHVLAVTSVKEGWGLVVTEAASQGTPSVGYNVDGFRDSIRDGITGVLTKKNTPETLAEEIVALLSDEQRYGKLRNAALQWSREITFDRSYEDFKKALKQYGF